MERWIGWPTSVITALSVFGAAFLAWVRDHRGVAIVLAIASPVVGELLRRNLNRIVDRLDQWMVGRLSRFGERYRKYLLTKLRSIDLKDLPTIGYYTPELDEVFVDVSLVSQAPHRVPADPLAALPPERPKRQSIWDFLDRPEPVVLAVIGAPGSGKTTLLRHTARQVCRSRGRRRDLPVLLQLRDHAATIAAAPQTGLAEILRGTLGRYADEEPPHWLERQLQHGRCLVLLDGLDEVAKQDDRRRVVDWVNEQIAQYPGNDYVITSRPHGYRTTHLAGAAVLQVCHFTDEQVMGFLYGWYLAVERHGTGTNDDAVRRARTAADDLLQRLRDAPGLYDLTVNPLLLTMIANVHRERGALPGSRADLYEEICEVLLGRRPEVPGGQKKVVLQELACTMMQRRIRDLARTDVLTIIGSVLPASPALTTEEFLNEVASSGLLIERENGVYAFVHQTFQEYLAAAHIRETHAISVLTGAVGESWWRDLILLYVARADAGPIVEACLADGTVSALALAFDCADQARELAPQLRVRLDGLLADVADPSIDPEHRRLIAGVTIARHLGERTRVASGGYLCLRPITIGIYELFLHDIRARGEKRMPECPDLTHPGTEGETVVGMRGSDALAFVAWINDMTGGAPVYRLPVRAEVDDLASRHIPGAVRSSIWLNPNRGGDAPQLWTPSGTDHPHTVDGQTLCRHLDADVEKTSLLVTLLLIRSQVLLRDLDIARDVVRDLGRDLGRDLERALDQAPALALERDLEFALEWTRDLPPDLHLSGALERDLVRACDLARERALDRGLDHAIDRALARAIDPYLARALALDLPRDLARDRALALDRHFDLVRDPALALALDRDLPRPIDREGDIARAVTYAFDRVLDRILVTVVGTVLSQSLSAAITSQAASRGAPSSSTLSTRFASHLAEKTGITTATYTPSPDALADQVRASLETFRRLRPPARPSLHSSDWWAAAVASWLEETAVPIFTRQRRLRSDEAVAIRLAALCLAGEARVEVDLRARFQEIAAGITLLERRLSGETPPTETILVALA